MNLERKTFRTQEWVGRYWYKWDNAFPSEPGNSSTPQFLHDFSREMSLMLYYIK